MSGPDLSYNDFFDVEQEAEFYKRSDQIDGEGGHVQFDKLKL